MALPQSTENCSTPKVVDSDLEKERQNVIKEIQAMFQHIGDDKLNFWGVADGESLVPLGCLKCSCCRGSLKEFMNNAPTPIHHIYFCERISCRPEYQRLVRKFLFELSGSTADLKEACKPYWDYVAKISQNKDTQRAFLANKSWVPLI